MASLFILLSSAVSGIPSCESAVEGLDTYTCDSHSNACSIERIVVLRNLFADGNVSTNRDLAVLVQFLSKLYTTYSVVDRHEKLRLQGS